MTFFSTHFIPLGNRKKGEKGKELWVISIWVNKECTYKIIEYHVLLTLVCLNVKFFRLFRLKYGV